MFNTRNRYEKIESTGAYLTANITMNGENSVLNQIVMKALSKARHSHSYAAVRFFQKVDEELQEKLQRSFGDVYIDSEDGYIIEASDEVNVYATSIRGLIYGAYSLQQLTINGYLNHGLIYNVPLCPFRGLKIYLPAKEDIDFFKSFIDMACYYRYNTIVIEIGGAMEYKRHPEINEGWVEYSAEMRRYSGRAKEVQRSSNWKKNSIHSENGGGEWLAQETVKDLVSYCKQRGLDVIPEVPSLSHSDYLLTRHPELAERKEDSYPDVYCPSNPASYELLFDVLDEVAEVFEPNVIHIGHDEYYSIGICDRCKGKDAAEIYAEDLKKIYSYLKSKGIETMLWGDKLLNAISKSGNAEGGSEREVHRHGQFREILPATYKSIDLIPKELRIMHWYWSVRREYDDEFLDRGMYMVFGNFSGTGIPEWSRRISKGVQGSCISNWSALREDYLQRNGVFFEMAYCCRLFWQDGYDESMYTALAEETFEDLFRYKNLGTLAGPHIEITHGTTFTREYQPFVDGIFIEPEQDLLGEYVLEFEDGAAMSHPVYYGINISSCDRSWEAPLSDRHDVYISDSSLLQVSCTTMPIKEGSKTFYKIVLEHPFSNRKLINVQFIPKPNLEGHVIVREIKLC